MAAIALNSALSANGFYNKTLRAWSRRASERTHPACGALVSLPVAGVSDANRSCQSGHHCVAAAIQLKVYGKTFRWERVSPSLK